MTWLPSAEVSGPEFSRLLSVTGLGSPPAALTIQMFALPSMLESKITLPSTVQAILRLPSSEFFRTVTGLSLPGWLTVATQILEIGSLCTARRPLSSAVSVRLKCAYLLLLGRQNQATAVVEPGHVAHVKPMRGGTELHRSIGDRYRHGGHS